MRRPAAILTALIIAVVVVTGTYGVGARPSDTRSDRDRVRSERANVAANLDALRASQAELNAALRVLEENVRVEQGRLDDAQQAVAAAEAQVAAAQRGIAQTTDRLGKLRATMRQVAIEAYVRPASSSMSAVLESESASDAAERQALQSLRSNRDADLTDEIRHRAGRAAGPPAHRLGRPGAGRAKAGRGGRAARQGPRPPRRSREPSWAR